MGIQVSPENGCADCRRRAALLGATTFALGAGLSLLIYVKFLRR